MLSTTRVANGSRRVARTLFVGMKKARNCISTNMPMKSLLSDVPSL